MIDLLIKSYITSDQKTKEVMTIKCESQIDEYFQSKIFKLSSTCFDLIKDKYENTAFIVEGGDLILFSFKNAILIKNSNSIDGIKIIGGKNSQITKITSLKLSKSKKSIVVVNDNKSILVFDTNISGDIGPITKHSIDNVLKAESIEIDEDRKVIRIIDSYKNLIEEFSFIFE